MAKRKPVTSEGAAVARALAPHVGHKLDVCVFEDDEVTLWCATCIAQVVRFRSAPAQPDPLCDYGDDPALRPREPDDSAETEAPAECG